MWLTLVLVHSIAVFRLARSRPGDTRQSWKSRACWLLLLAFVNPLPLISSAVVLMLVVKVWLDDGPVELAAS